MDETRNASIDAQAAEVTGESHPDDNAVSLSVRRDGDRGTLTVPGDDPQRPGKGRHSIQ